MEDARKVFSLGSLVLAAVLMLTPFADHIVFLYAIGAIVGMVNSIMTIGKY